MSTTADGLNKQTGSVDDDSHVWKMKIKNCFFEVQDSKSLQFVCVHKFKNVPLNATVVAKKGRKSELSQQLLQRCKHTGNIYSVVTNRSTASRA